MEQNTGIEPAPEVTENDNFVGGLVCLYTLQRISTYFFTALKAFSLDV